MCIEGIVILSAVGFIVYLILGAAFLGFLHRKHWCSFGDRAYLAFGWPIVGPIALLILAGEFTKSRLEKITTAVHNWQPRKKLPKAKVFKE